MLLRYLAAAFSLSTAALAAPYVDVTFYKDVLPILRGNCQNCHRPGEIGPVSFLTYESTVPWAHAIKKAVLAKNMPPQFTDGRFGHLPNGRLAEADIRTLVEWVDSGAPAGDPNDTPPFEWREGSNTLLSGPRPGFPDGSEQRAGLFKLQAWAPREQLGMISVAEIAQKIRLYFDKFWRISSS
jgi:hypothetical protein